MSQSRFKELMELIHSGNIMKFYKSPEWKKLRTAALKRDHYECQKCKAKGKYRKADCVHHIKHVKQFPLLALVLSNLISLCNSCHDEEHPEKLKKNKSKPKFMNEERW